MVHLGTCWQTLNYYTGNDKTLGWKQQKHKTASVGAVLVPRLWPHLPAPAPSTPQPRPRSVCPSALSPAAACLLDPPSLFSSFHGEHLSEQPVSVASGLPQNPLVAGFLQGWTSALPVLASVLPRFRMAPHKELTSLIPSVGGGKKLFFPTHLGFSIT